LGEVGAIGVQAIGDVVDLERQSEVNR